MARFIGIEGDFSKGRAHITRHGSAVKSRKEDAFHAEQRQEGE